MFDLLTDQNFLNALAVVIGPLAFFAAPTEEIEHLIFEQDLEFEQGTVGELAPASVASYDEIEVEIAKAA